MLLMILGATLSGQPLPRIILPMLQLSIYILYLGNLHDIVRIYMYFISSTNHATYGFRCNIAWSTILRSVRYLLFGPDNRSLSNLPYINRYISVGGEP